MTRVSRRLFCARILTNPAKNLEVLDEARCILYVTNSLSSTKG
jgi:hypothetical protein